LHQLEAERDSAKLLACGRLAPLRYIVTGASSADGQASATGGDDDLWVAAMRAQAYREASDCDYASADGPTSKDAGTGGKSTQKPASLNVSMQSLSLEASRLRQLSEADWKHWSQSHQRLPHAPGSSLARMPPNIRKKLMEAYYGDCHEPPQIESSDWNKWIGASEADEVMYSIPIPARRKQPSPSKARISIPGIDGYIGMPGQRAQPEVWYSRFARQVDRKRIQALIQLKQVAMRALKRRGHPAGTTGEPVEPMELSRSVAKSVRSAVRRMQSLSGPPNVSGRASDRKSNPATASNELAIWHWHDVLRCPPIGFLKDLPPLSPPSALFRNKRPRVQGDGELPMNMSIGDKKDMLPIGSELARRSSLEHTRSAVQEALSATLRAMRIGFEGTDHRSRTSAAESVSDIPPEPHVLMV